MQVSIPHSLGREEVRRRLESGKGEIAGFVPGGMAEVDTAWAGEDRLNLRVRTMGQAIDGHIDVFDEEVIFFVDLPPMLGFVQPMIEGALREGGRKLLT